MKVKIFTVCALLFIFFSLTFFWGCTDKYKPAPSKFSSSEETSCTYCHLNAALLKEVATPLPPDPGGTGEG